MRTPSGQYIASYIRRLIFEGELRAGMRVPQDAIASDLGVSRIPVREALIVLEREGWVTNEMHRGAFISALDEQAVHDHYELFGLIYGFAAKRAWPVPPTISPSTRRTFRRSSPGRLRPRSVTTSRSPFTA